MKQTKLFETILAVIKFIVWYVLVFALGLASRIITKLNKNSATKWITRFRHPLNSHIKRCRQLNPRPVSTHLNQDVDVSIIIPVFNQWHLTKACLNSILDTCGDEIGYELILADDCSTDETRFATHYYPGLHVIKTPQNLGFLNNCNHAALKAQGRYIVLLNNDTIVLPNWLQTLYNTLETDKTAAIAGSKILFRNGKIQEAGVALFQDGTVHGIGYGHHRFTPIFNIKRETDYISGCSIMLRKSFWDEVGGFDQRYQPAYYEDSDIAMSARMLNMRIIYQPASEVIHYKHKTYARYMQKNRRALLKKNKALFLEKWHAALKEHPVRGHWHLAMSQAERTPLLSQPKTKSHFNILFYTPDPLYPNKHGNRVRMCKLIENFQMMGHTVHVALLKSSECTEDNLNAMRQELNLTIDLIPSQNIRVSPGFVPYDGWYEKGIGESIRCLCDKYQIDVVICSYVFQCKLLEYVPSHLLKIIDTHDKMANRTKMLRSNKLSIGQFSCSIADEAAYLKRADVVIGITEEETQYFKKIGQHNVVTISHWAPPQFLQKKCAFVRHVGIVASNNRFNRAMLQLFLEAMNTHLQDSNECPFTIHIVGEIKNGIRRRQFLSPKMRIFKKPWVINHGFVANISQIYEQMDIIISPMMCGTGINIKMVEALAYGMPMLTTRFGARGIETNDPMHQHADINSLVTTLFALHQKPHELERLATLSQKIYLQFYAKHQIGFEALFNHPKLAKISSYESVNNRC